MRRKEEEGRRALEQARKEMEAKKALEQAAAGGRLGMMPAAVEAGTSRMVPTLDAAWGALQALISQEQEQGQEQGPEPSGDEDEEDEAEETLRENGAESGNGGDVVMG